MAPPVGSTMAEEGSTLAGAVARGVLDAELAGLLRLLAEKELPIVVVGPESRSAERLRAAIVAARHASSADAAGGVLVADSLEDVLRLSGAAAGGNVPDELRELGVVIILRGGDGESPERVVAAHYVRPLERDPAGHVQRRPPAILAAWDEKGDRFEHFAWGVTVELAARAGIDAPEFERAHRQHTARIAAAAHSEAADSEAATR
jgi:hypothetical protein